MRSQLSGSPQRGSSAAPPSSTGFQQCKYLLTKSLSNTRRAPNRPRRRLPRGSAIAPSDPMITADQGLEQITKNPCGHLGIPIEFPSLRRCGAVPQDTNSDLPEGWDRAYDGPRVALRTGPQPARAAAEEGRGRTPASGVSVHGDSTPFLNPFSAGSRSGPMPTRF